MLKREPRKCWRHLIRSLQIVRDTVFLSRHDYLVIETPRWDANDSFTDKQTSTHTRLVLIAIRFDRELERKYATADLAVGNFLQ